MSNTQTVYLYDQTTGEYQYPYEAQQSPLESDVFIIPFYSTIDSPLAPKDGFTINFINGSWQYVTSLITEPVPSTVLTIDEQRALMIVTAAQAHAAIAESNPTLYASINTYMQQSTTAVNDQIFWNKAQIFKRLSPSVIRLAVQFNLSDTDLDNLFTLAATKDA